jgi:predicted HTH domain antitoxin
MGTTRIAIELPAEVAALLGPEEGIPTRVRQAVVLDLLRDVEISQGLAARLLGVTRWDILQLMAKYEIPSGPLTAEEVDRDIKNARLGTRFAESDVR